MDALGVMRRLFLCAFDAVLPPRERTIRTQRRDLEDIPLAPTVHEILGVRVTTIMEYRHAATQDLIRALKYDGSGAAAALAAAVLADYLREEIANLRLFSPREVLLVPIPLHPSRRRERGFNQVEIVLRALPSEFCDGTLSRLSPAILTRTKATSHQTRLPRSQRIQNMQGAFAVPDPAQAKNKQIILIDDVATTGATLKHAGRALARSGATVSLLALARA